MFDECIDSFWSTSHIRNFSNAKYGIIYQVHGIFSVQFVLGCTRQSNIYFYFPWTTSFYESRTRELVGIRCYDIVARSTQFKHIVNLFSADTFRVINITVRSGDGNYLCSQLSSFGGSSPCHITESGDGYCLSFYFDALFVEHVFYEIQAAEARSFRTNQ